MIRLRQLLAGGFAVVLALIAGCSNDSSEPAAASRPSAEGAKYILASEPAGAQGVIEVRAKSRDQEPVVVVGRIGGAANPWVEELAAFDIVDPKLQACSDIPGDSCPKPWDYCCVLDELPAAKATVKIVDAGGETVAVDARQLLGLKELQTVVVRGTAQRDAAGNLTVLADGIYVRN
jgi:hypothetical protein